MVSTEESEDINFVSFVQLAEKLNLEQNIATQAWSSYIHIKPRYDLEGDQLHWLGCSVFVACRNTTTPTVGMSVLEGNCVSLTSLLRHSNLSLSQFFTKIKRWAEMTKLSDEFHRKIESLQSKVAVAFNIFQVYCPVFIEIFNSPTDTETRQHRNRRQRPLPCSPSQLFDFCWLLFVTVKTEDDSYNTDLVKSHHLLHACCDLAFQNAFLDDRKDLLNPNFSCLPREWPSSDGIIYTNAPCIIPNFYKDDVRDAMYIKEYEFREIIKNLFETNILQGNAQDFTGLFNPSVFDSNYNNLKRTYETHLLTNGDFDERIFLAEFRRQNKIKQQMSVGENIEPVQTNENLRQPPVTPLTGRKYLGPRQSSDAYSSVDLNRIRLGNLLSNRNPNPNEELKEIYSSCDNNPEETIQNIFLELQTKYVAKCTNLNVHESEVTSRSTLALKLAYKFLEDILKSERKRFPDISFLMQKTIFFKCLYACSLEVVEYSHNGEHLKREFPWVLSTLELTAYDFVKVIEITIRSDNQQLPRYIVKHLSWVEERVLESLMWQDGSALFDAIQQSGEAIPKFEDIALPGHMKYGSNQNDVKPAQISNTDSPGPSAMETFQSPNINVNSTHVANSQVKKNLFPTIKPGQSLLQNNKPTHLMVTDEDGNRKLVKIVDSPNSEQIVATPSLVPEAKPKKGGSLCIIFRKFYNLAGVRMDHLCSKLGITSMDLQCKIWTLFEYSVRDTDLMKNRHLDQLLMCAVYVICKVLGHSYRFIDIMKQYREQPQANSEIYRDVLIAENADPTRSDLIAFYNTVYVSKTTQFALKFSNETARLSLALSPLPLVKSMIASPKTEIQKNVFIKPYDSPTKTLNTGKILNYCFNRSTSEDLRNINNVINTNGKRLLENYDADVLVKRPSNRKVATLIEERRIQNIEAE